MSFARQLFEAMNTYGERPALIAGREELRYADVTAQATCLASNLAALGVGAGDRIGIAIKEPLDALLASFACWRLSATPAMIDFRAPRVDRQRLARDFGLSAVLESRSPPGQGDYPAATFDPRWRFASAPANDAPETVDCSNPAFLLFSSGTTGTPKAYVQTHETLSGRITGRVHGPRDGAPPRYLTGMTLTYSATRHHLLGHLFAGGVAKLLPPLFTPSEMIEALLAFKATGTGQPPPIIARMVGEAGERSQPLFPHLNSLDSIGGPARPEDKVAAWHNLSHGYRISYASTLTGAVSCLAGPDVPERAETAGRLNKGVRVDILDGDGNVLPPGESGLIKAWTPTVASAVLLPGGGSFIDPRVMGPGWGIPGDIGYLDADGFLTIVDRSEDMIVRGGVNIAPQELEKLIRLHPQVLDVAVAGFSDPVMGQEIAAFVVGRSEITVGDLRAFLAANVSPEKRPREIRLVRSLPYSDNGKLLRRVLVDELRQSLAQPGS